MKCIQTFFNVIFTNLPFVFFSSQMHIKDMEVFSIYSIQISYFHIYHSIRIQDFLLVTFAETSLRFPTLALSIGVTLILRFYQSFASRCILRSFGKITGVNMKFSI